MHDGADDEPAHPALAALNVLFGSLFGFVFGLGGFFGLRRTRGETPARVVAISSERVPRSLNLHTAIEGCVLFQATRVFALACVAAFGLAACGGGGSSAPSAPKTKFQGQGRKVMSVPCTPDSYGYCYVKTYDSTTRNRCDNGQYYISGSRTYEIYDSTTDLGEYQELLWGVCNDPDGGPVQNWSWEPNDPAQVYSDPNLP